MILSTLKALTWATVITALCSALLLAAAGGGMPADAAKASQAAGTSAGFGAVERRSPANHAPGQPNPTSEAATTAR